MPTARSRGLASAFDQTVDVFAEGGELPPITELMSRVRESWLDLGRSEPLSVDVLIDHDREAALADFIDAAERDGASTRVIGPNLVARTSDDDGDYLTLLVPSPAYGVRLLVGAHSPTSDRWKTAGKWVRWTAPHLTPFYLNQSDIERIIRSIEAATDDVRITQFSARKFDDRSSSRRSWRQGQRAPNLDEVLAEIENEAALTKALIRTATGNSFHLSRNGAATYYEGSFALFHEAIIKGIAEAAAARRELLTGRQREEARPLPAAVAVRSAEPVFSDAEARIALPEQINRLSSTGVAVLHGNPYVLLTVTDYGDGSNFDVFVTDEHQVTVYPGYRASPGAFARLTDHVAEIIGAEEISVRGADEGLTFEDLVSEV